MMKKLLLMSAVGALGAFGASAQSSAKVNGVFLQNKQVDALPLSSSMMTSTFTTTPVEGTDPSAKTTVGGARWYSYAEYISFLGVNIADSTQLPYIWNKGDAKAIYGDGAGGIVADTIQLGSYGISFDPAFKSSTTSSTFLEGFNDPAAYDPGSIVVTRTKPYVVDTVRVFTTYGRNNLKTSFVDTLRVVVVYGNGGTSDLPFLSYNTSSTSTYPKAQYGYDTITFAGLKYNPATGSTFGTTQKVYNLLLKNTDTSSFIKGYDVPVGLNVPAGNIVGISATFVTGHPYIPYVDTVFYSTDINPANPFNMGMMRPRFFAEAPTPTTKSAPSYPEYHPGYFNTGFVKFLPNRLGTDYDARYAPSYLFVKEFSYEIPDIDVKVSCATCNTIQEMSILENTIYAEVNAFPNPANTELNIPFVLKEKASVTVRLTNLMGQVVATKNMGAVNVGQVTTATFNTSSLPSGVYLYNITANGQTVSNRFTIAK